MTSILKRVFISLGLALIIGAVVGFIQSEEKYYLAHPRFPKREVSKEGMKEDYSHLKEHIIEERFYNTGEAIIYGLASFGGLLVISMLIKKRD